MFNVADNLLSGPVPKFQSETASVAIENNPGLCTSWRFDRSFKGGFVIGYVVFGVSTIVLYASYCVPWVYIGSRNQRMTVPAMVLHMLKKRKNKRQEFHHFAALSTFDFLHEKEVTNSENFVTRMRYEDLHQATVNFSADNIVGRGETGTIYKASLPNGWSLAVKKFSTCQNSEEQFITELKILGRLQHDNINPLIRFCKELRKRILVYKHASNGSLFDWLHSMDGERKNMLTWPIRMKIAVGLARGLAWLHQSCNFQVAHLNVSSKSVLRDKNFEPRLSNFGKATLVDPNEMHYVSRGFVVDMEFWEQCFVKEDVFNFGVVLIELITRENDVFSSMSSKEDAINELIKGEGDNNEMVECVSIANECMHPFAEQRPTMFDVYAKISTIADTSAN